MSKKVLVTGSSRRTDKVVAAMLGFLMSEYAVYITRQVISVNGGLC